MKNVPLSFSDKMADFMKFGKVVMMLGISKEKFVLIVEQEGFAMNTRRRLS